MNDFLNLHKSLGFGCLIHFGYRFYLKSKYLYMDTKYDIKLFKMRSFFFFNNFKLLIRNNYLRWLNNEIC